ncbi:MAG: hypothetical protein AAB386_04465 [Patescibacteria group bacterium]
MPPRSKTATKVAVSAQTKVLIAVVSIVAFGLAAVGYGYGFGFGSIRPTSLTTTRQATKPIVKPIEKPPVLNSVGGVPQIAPPAWPTFTKLPLFSTTLANMDVDLYKFQLSYKPSESFQLKQLVFAFEANAGFTLSSLHNLRLSKGSMNMNLNDYDITCPSCGGDVKSGTVTYGASPYGFLVVTMKGEEWVSGSGSVYTLHGTLSGVTAGSKLKITPYRVSTPKIANGYLTNNSIEPFMLSYPNIVNIDTTNPPKAASSPADFAGIFVWSVSSTGYHNSNTGLKGGSSDWYSDIEMESSQLTQELSL